MDPGQVPSGREREHLTMHTINDYATEVRRTLDTRGDPMTYAVWQAFALSILIGAEPLDMLRHNVAKLRARYPDGFVEGGGVR